MTDPTPDIPQISVNNAMSPWRMAPEHEVNTGKFKVVIRFFGASNQLVQAEVAKRQNSSALIGATTPEALNDEEFRQDVESWCKIALVSWDMMSDPVMKGKRVVQQPQPVPIKLAPDIFCSHGIGGKELYFALFQASRDRSLFVVTDEDEAKAEKNLPK